MILPAAVGIVSDVLSVKSATSTEATLEWKAPSGGGSLIKSGTNYVTTSSFTGDANNIIIGSTESLMGASARKNIAIGYAALRASVSGEENTAIGYGALLGATGDNNTAIGLNSGTSITTGSNNITIGHYAQVPTSFYSNQLSIANFIYGTRLNSFTTGKIGIGVTNPLATLSVGGDTMIYGDLILRDDASNDIKIKTPATVAATYSLTLPAAIGLATDVLSIKTVSSGDAILEWKAPSGSNPVVAGTLTLGEDGSSDWGTIVLHDSDNSTDNTLTIKAPSGLTSNLVYTMPDNNGLTSQYLTTNGAGVMSWTSGGGSLKQSTNSSFYTNVNYTGKSGDNNVSIGNGSFQSFNSGGYNVAIGAQTLSTTTSSTGNTAVGYEALKVVSGNYNTSLGYGSGNAITSGAKNITIGYYAQVANQAVSDQLSIGNLIYGTGVGTLGSGNIGIGTNAPRERLEVDGNIISTGFLYALQPGGGFKSSYPDYVFEKYYDKKSILKPSYTMMSLEDIEKFTKKNKHLPGVPSIKEVEENDGLIALNRFTLMNLEKIEELFLHTIKQQKEIKRLKNIEDSKNNEIKQLKSQLKDYEKRLAKIEASLGL
ncbi:MAG: hypothetical protein HRT66_01885, partial [Flavobacteriaceae bacterium]|nr:hypothetical protein [Flavobacteriaceae bacterium]